MKMEEFNFSSLTPIQQEAPSSMMTIMNSTSPLILSTQPHGCDLNSSLLNVVGGGKENEDATMYITVDTGPPSSNIIPLLNTSPSPVSSFPTTTNTSNISSGSFTSDQNIATTNNGNTTIASLVIDTDTSRNSLSNYFPSSVNHSSKTSTSYMDNDSSMAIQVHGHHSNKSEAELGQSSILASFPSSELSGPSSLFCGECSVILPSSGDFFEHWVTNHCQLLQPSNTPELQKPSHQETNITNATAISSDEMKNLIISGNSITNSSHEAPNLFSSETATTGLVMEKCSVCNHIFVQGTDRHKQHSRSGPCVLNSNDMNMIERRHNVDIVNNNNQPPDCRISAPINNENIKVDIVQEPIGSNSESSADSLLLPAVSPIIAHTIGNKKRKFGGIFPVTSDISERGTIKKQEASTISSNKNCVCGVCNAPVKTITSYFLHWLEQHQDSLSMNFQTGENSVVEGASSASILQEVWQCRACPSSITKLFPNCEMLSRHVTEEHKGLNTIEQNDQYITSSCKIIFHGKESFDKHAQVFHLPKDNNNGDSPNEDSNLICHLCDKNFTLSEKDNNSSLCDHYREEHLVKCKGEIYIIYYKLILSELNKNLRSYFIA